MSLRCQRTAPFTIASISTTDVISIRSSSAIDRTEHFAVNAPARAADLAGEATVERLGPPRPPFTLCVGVTGHRADVLPAGSVDPLRERIRGVLTLIDEAGAGLAKEQKNCFSECAPAKRFVSPIADGADQIAAEVALELGWELQAVLPFDRARYRATLGNDGARERFDSLLANAACVLELPGDSTRELDAYVMTGRATVAQCDILIAIWDGLPPRGRGGTGEVAMLAI